MHDVLGHRLSLLSVHAGALEFRPDAAPAEIARAALVIRGNAHLALQDLREVVGVLRAWTEAYRAEVEAVQTGPAPPGVGVGAPVGELPSPPWPTSPSWWPSRAGPGCGWAWVRTSPAVSLLSWWAGPSTGSRRRA